SRVCPVARLDRNRLDVAQPGLAARSSETNNGSVNSQIGMQQRLRHVNNEQTQLETLPMNVQQLIETASAMVAGDKGLLAMDESTPTCHKRFAALGIAQTEE